MKSRKMTSELRRHECQQGTMTHPALDRTDLKNMERLSKLGTDLEPKNGTRRNGACTRYVSEHDFK